MTFEHSLLSLALASKRRRHRALRRDADALQARALARVITSAKGTVFGIDHDLDGVAGAVDYAARVPLRTYADYAEYWALIRRGVSNVLLPGHPRYWALTGGTTGAEKLIPIYDEALGQSRRSFDLGLSVHVSAAREARVLGTKILFLGSCAPLQMRDGLPTGFMSSILARELSPVVKTMIVPGERVNHLPNWQDKIPAIVDMLSGARLSIAAGMPPWLAAFFRDLVERTGRPVLDTWPDLSLVLHSGVSMESYRATIEELLVGRDRTRLPRFMNAFGATEGNLAFQDDPDRDDMLLVTDEVFFELVRLDDYLAEKPHPPRLTLKDARVGEDYVLVLNTPGGLRGYVIGDTVRFTSVQPPRIVISGRTTQVLNHAGEKVSVEQLTRALGQAAARTGASVTEFSLCPTLADLDGQKRVVPGHKWFVEFAVPPSDDAAFGRALDDALSRGNPLYALRRRSAMGRTPLLAAPEVVPLPPGTFERWQSRAGRVGGHFKVARISNEERLAQLLSA